MRAEHTYTLGYTSTFYALFRKTLFKDVVSIIKFGLTVLLFIATPLYILFIEYIVPHPTSSIFAYDFTLDVILFSFQYSYSLLLFSFFLIPSSTLISNEFTHNTILVLESHPLTRFRILLSKTIAVFLYNGFVGFISISIVSSAAFVLYGFYDTFIFFLVNMGFCLFLSAFLVGLSMGISALFQSSQHAVAISFVIFLFATLFSFISFYFITADIYENSFLFLFDLNYNLANVYVGLHKSFGYQPPSEFRFFHIMEQGIETNYATPVFSLLYLGLIALVMMGLGYWRFKTRQTP